MKLPLTIRQLLSSPPQPHTQLTVHGHVRSVRLLKKVAFLDLADHSSHHQLMCVLPTSDAQSLTTGQSVSVTGLWQRSKGAEQPYELNLTTTTTTEVGRGNSVQVLGGVPDTYPLQKKFHSLPYLRTLPSLRWRTSYLASILRFRSHVDWKLHEFFQREQFFKVNPPVITSSDCEGAGELFQLESKSMLQEQQGSDEKKKKKNQFFGKDAYLTVSTQLHLEVLSASLGRVWSLSPTFRAESSDTNRHLAEFWMLEAEISYLHSVHQLTHFTERMIKHVLGSLLDKQDTQVADNLLESLPNNRTDEEEQNQNQHQINSTQLRERWAALNEKEWKTVTYREAIDALKNSTQQFKIPVSYEDGVATEHEKYLAGEHFGNVPVFITDYPRKIKPFYMKHNNDADDTVACFDLIFPQIGEIIGGSLREHDLASIEKEMALRGMKSSEMDWYLSTRVNGSVPHGGFGLGMERLISYLSGVENLRDVVPFPRARDECVA